VAPTLVVLAGGLGSRFGGPKQLEPVGAGGATLMDYSVYDAAGAGFGRVVFVLRPDIAAEFEATRGRLYRRRLPVELALQRLEDLPAGFSPPAARPRPWGTAQAVWAARDRLDGPFAVLNADDFYGRAAIVAIAEFLRGVPAGAAEYAVVGYRLDGTMSPGGGVNRAVLEPDAGGWVTGLAEVRGLRATDEGDFRGEVLGQARQYPGATPVSMNCWGFTPAVLPAIERRLRAFLEAGPAPSAELQLPDVIAAEIRDSHARVRLLTPESRWCGITYPGDTPAVRATIAELVRRGEYPADLWS
jgi:hypothetical protein